MRDAILKIIKQIQSKRKESKQFPEHAMYSDVLRELRLMADSELSAMVEAGTLKRVPTLNSHAYEVITKKQASNELQSDLPEA